ncbi:MAG: protein phosphatase 2C domain-containing protein [Deltaproteobacteria bacterium]|nr:protein phosphatase 2C domain-containing protein [Deltaproteobacteria bacterium]
MTSVFSFDNEDTKQRCGAFFTFGLDCLGIALTDKGGREENQDSWGLAIARDGSLVMAVADGLGGHIGGRIAARLAVMGAIKVSHEEGFDGHKNEWLEKMFINANNDILAAQMKDPSVNEMRSTLLVAIIKDYRLIWGFIGDVRLYLIRNNKIISQTKDQSVPQMLVDAGVIGPEDIRGHPDRNRLLQALGGGDEKNMADLTGISEFFPGDLLVASSDGFWELIYEESLLGMAQNSSPFNIVLGADRHIQEIIKNGDHGLEFDNYSVIAFTRDNLKDLKDYVDLAKKNNIMLVQW